MIKVEFITFNVNHSYFRPTCRPSVSTLNCIECSRTLPRYPLLYLDKINLLSTSGPSYGPLSGGYNFSLTWRHNLTGVHSTALGLYNFKTGGGKILDFNAELLSVTTSSATVNLKPVGSNAGIVYLSYSVVVVTQNNSYIDLVTTVTNNLIDYT